MVKGFRTKDNWDHGNDNMRCATCLWSHRKTDGMLRCRANAPTVKGWPVMFDDDWCGEHKLDGNKLEDRPASNPGDKMPQHPGV